MAAPHIGGVADLRLAAAWNTGRPGTEAVPEVLPYWGELAPEPGARAVDAGRTGCARAGPCGRPEYRRFHRLQDRGPRGPATATRRGSGAASTLRWTRPAPTWRRARCLASRAASMSSATPDSMPRWRRWTSPPPKWANNGSARPATASNMWRSQMPRPWNSWPATPSPSAPSPALTPPGGAAAACMSSASAAAARAMNAFASFYSAGVPICFGSDSPVTPLRPWSSVRACLEHHNHDRADLGTRRVPRPHPGRLACSQVPQPDGRAAGSRGAGQFRRLGR